MPEKSKAEMRSELQQAIVNTGGEIVATPEPVTDTRSMIRFLVGKMNEIVEGKLDASKCTGITNMAQQIYNMKNMELKTALALHKLGADKKIEAVKFDE